MSEPAIVAQDIVKHFMRREERGFRRFLPGGTRATTTAVDGVSLEVREGELFGLLGPNGAGKTTLVKILSTLLLPTSGSGRVAGHDLLTEADAIRRKVGVVLGGERALYWRLTARENLRFFYELYDLPRSARVDRIEELLSLVGLADRADERVENYSKGMKQRLHLARGLLHDPEILLLDEPSIGLDPGAAREMRALVRKLTDEQGKTVILTTHYLYEADELSHRVGIINKGRLIAIDTPAALKARLADRSSVELRLRGAPAGFERELAKAAGVTRVAPVPDAPAPGQQAFRVLVSDPDLAGRGIVQAVSRTGAALLSLESHTPSLEDVFLALTGDTLAGADARPAPREAA